jgi:hypothetical protein
MKITISNKITFPDFLLELSEKLKERLTGDISVKEREQIVERLNKGMVKVLIATGHLIVGKHYLPLWEIKIIWCQN